MASNNTRRHVFTGAALLAALAVGATVGSATAGQRPAEKATTGEISALFQEWNAAVATGDSNKVADRYAPDAVLLPTVSNRVRTDRTAIVDYFDHFLANKPSGQILASTVSVLDEDSAVDTGTYRFAFADGSTVDARYSYTYEKRDGRWLIVNHHSSAMPQK